MKCRLSPHPPIQRQKRGNPRQNRVCVRCSEACNAGVTLRPRLSTRTMQGWQDLEAGLTASAPGHSAEEAEHASCTATLEDLRIVVNLLQGLSTGKKDQLVTVSTPPQALRVSAETQARNLYGVAYINVRQARPRGVMSE